ncbi:MAG: mannonate dehydratase [Defluviitaleaceae bacterium]|nr:mannonate dehydratase [Defluviitaleaceae bacterium]MCL2239153.1 mannonate dehydratase [Defluviitaleaceae bacterium]
MKMTFRWFGPGADPVQLQHIKQIPGMTGVVTSLLDMPAGEAWPMTRIMAMKNEIAAAGLEVEVIESVNIHEDIKLGAPGREEKIENYIITMQRLAQVGIKCICYNMMPVLDWARSHLYYDLPDGSNTMRYQAKFIEAISPEALATRYAEESEAYEMPGWEPERMKHIRASLEAYANLTEDDFYANMKYFLDAIIPHAEELGILMGVHPDDPPQPIFGLPKLIISRENLRRYLDLHPSKHNGLTLCTGSLGASRANDVPALIREFGAEGRIHFAHVRNLKFETETDFYESAHYSPCGSLDMYGIMKALHDVGFDKWVRPDHGRMIWDETTKKGRPGYGLYDRALGANYLLGLWEAIGRGGAL